MATAPRMLEGMDWNYQPDGGTDWGEKDHDFEEGGIYAAEAIRRMDLFRQAPRAGQGLAAQLSLQQPGSRGQGQRTLFATDLFPDIRALKNTWESPGFSFVRKIWNLFMTYGHICSIIVGTGIIIKFFSWVAEVVIRLCTRPVTGNVCLHVMCAFFPSLRDFFRDASSCWPCCGGFTHRYVITRGSAPPTETTEQRDARHQDLIRVYAQETADQLKKDLGDAGAVQMAALKGEPSYVAASKVEETRLYPDAKREPLLSPDEERRSTLSSFGRK